MSEEAQKGGAEETSGVKSLEDTEERLQGCLD